MFAVRAAGISLELKKVVVKLTSVQVGDVDNNLNRADAILNKANPQDLDLLVLPELAVTGKYPVTHHCVSM